MSKEKLLAVVGPTAVGKTALAVRIAQKFGGEIISGDSMLVYRGFNIGAAKPTLIEQGGIPHHLIDILAPAVPYSAADFQREAGRIITTLNEKRILPIVAGGTCLYVKALLEGYRFGNAVEDPAYRRELNAMAALQGKEKVYALLTEKAPEVARAIHPHNLRRVIRALETIKQGERGVSRQKETDGELCCYDVYVVGLCLERATLYRRIEQRVEAMLKAGLIDEVQGLMEAGVSREAPAMQGIGYKETAAYLAGEITRDELSENIKKNTRHFAKRQLTWYRRMPYIHWYDMEDGAERIWPSLMAEIARREFTWW
ncbi:MAG: tRNA (adenosine(37)-N6)-dimethylallyltransferase MiaA [Selenomonadaceae bacterium]|nr:tRNA (adenosine(37)-N6)-dimethylallyltransferase MiaA [Selenomonadaceae bacterium]